MYQENLRGMIYTSWSPRHLDPSDFIYSSSTHTVHGREPLPSLDAHEVQAVKKELAIIRDKVNTLLDALDVQPKGTETAPATAAPVTTSQPTQPVGVVTASKPEGKLPHSLHIPSDGGGISTGSARRQTNVFCGSYGRHH